MYIRAIFLWFVISYLSFSSLFADDKFYYKGKTKVDLIYIGLDYDRNIDYYETRDGIELGVGDTIIVQFDSSLNIQEYLSSYNLQIKNDYGGLMYVLQSPNRNTTLDIANQLSQKSDVLFAEPNFYKRLMKR